MPLIFVPYNKLTTVLRHNFRLSQGFKNVSRCYDIFPDLHDSRRPVVSLSDASKIVPSKSALAKRDFLMVQLTLERLGIEFTWNGKRHRQAAAFDKSVKITFILIYTLCFEAFLDICNTQEMR